MTSGINLGLLLLRLAVGVVFLAHGWNHVFGGGKITGTARWFDSLGMRPGIVHAWTASLTELGAGALLVLGLLTPLAGAGVVGVMLVAWVTNHARNGFFIFRPGEGYEYVMTLTFGGLALAATGGGRVVGRPRGRHLRSAGLGRGGGVLRPRHRRRGAATGHQLAAGVAPGRSGGPGARACGGQRR